MLRGKKLLCLVVFDTMNESFTRLARYEAMALRLSDHLEQKLDIEGYPDQPSWGYAFTALLAFSISRGQPSEFGQRALRCLADQDSTHPNFSWEFVVYAVQKTKQLLPPNSTLPCDVNRSKGTRMLNWFFLRQVNRGWFKGNKWGSLLKLRLAKHIYTDQSGLIMDELATRSLQYHAFCLYLLCDLVDRYPEIAFLKQWLIEGAEYSAENILPDGTALWIGRGQEQIFGYGSLVYALEYVHHCLKPLKNPAVLDQLQKKLISFQNQNGSFPLVLCRREPEPPEVTFANAPPGWYGYNTLYDYQPFLGYTLLRVSRLREIK